MNKYCKIFIYFFVLVCFLKIFTKNNTVEHFKYIYDNDCENNKKNKTINRILRKYNIDKGDINDWDIFIPCSYNIPNQIKNKLNYLNKKNKYIFILEKCDVITSKSNLWILLLKKYGLDKSIKMMPESFILKDFIDGDYKRFIQSYKKNNLYIMKKNIQQQKGLHITNNLQDIINGYKNGYVICQKLLQNPYLINKRKINLRIYLLLCLKNNKLNGYVHKNGFMYYTKNSFKKNSKNINDNITTGYIDRKVYIKNPLTHNDFRSYLNDPLRKLSKIEKNILNNNDKISDIVFYRIYKLINNVLQACENDIKTDNDSTNFQLFGVDIAICNKLYPMIMEINKGPDLNAKDKRDKQVKLKVVSDMIKTIGLKENINNDFIQVL